MGNFSSTDNIYTDYRWLELNEDFPESPYYQLCPITTSLNYEKKLFKSSRDPTYNLAEDNFDYDKYNHSLKLNNHTIKRSLYPITNLAVYRSNRNSQSNFKLLTPFKTNFLDGLQVFYYSEIFDHFQIDINDNFIIQFTHHVSIIHNDLIKIFTKHLPLHLEKFHNLKNEKLSFSKLRNILAKDFAYSNDNKLKPYGAYFIRSLTHENFYEEIPKMMIEEGDLFSNINDIISNSKDINIYTLFYLLCLLFVYGQEANHNEIDHTYKNISHIDLEMFKQSNMLMNFDFISTTKNKECTKYMQNVLEISYERIINKNWYLSLKGLDTESFSQYKSEQEVIVQPYCIFEVLDVIQKENGSYYIHLFMRSNCLSDCVTLNMMPGMQLNLGVCTDIGSNIFEMYPGVQLEKIASLTITKKADLFSNLTSIGCMKNLRIFDIKNIELNDEDIVSIIPYLSTFTYLNYLNMSMNNISHIGVNTLCQTFKMTPFIEYINLNQNNLNENGGVELANGIQYLKHLRSVGLIFNFLYYRGIDALSFQLAKCTKLKMINLTGNFIYNEEMDTLIWSINSMKHLMYLNLSINQIGSEGLAMIGDVLPETIQHLNFSENRITQEGFMDFSTNLKRIPNLLALVLYGNRNGPTAIQCLGENFKYISKLQVLNLGCNYIGDAEVLLLTQYFSQMPSLLTLNLCENSVTNDGLFIIINSLHQLSTLVNLDLGWNNINGDSLNGLANCVNNLKDFTTLNLDGNPIAVPSLKTLMNELKEFDTNWICNKGIFSRKINKKELFAEKYILQKKKLTKELLQYINLNEKEIEDKLQTITQYEHVNKLILEKNVLTLPFTKILVNSFTSLTQLKEMNLRSNNIEDDILIEISNGLKQIPTLQILNLSGNAIGSLGTLHLAKNLIHLQSLIVLNLSWNSIGDDGLIALSHVCIPNLEVLLLDDNEINIKGIIEFSSNLHNFKRLVELNLSWNNVCSEGLKFFSKNMKQIKNLRILEIGHAQIGDGGIEEFTLNINVLNNLEKIVLLNNTISDIGGKSLLKAIGKCPSLKVVDVSRNLLSEEIEKGFLELENKKIITLEGDI